MLYGLLYRYGMTSTVIDAAHAKGVSERSKLNPCNIIIVTLCVSHPQRGIGLSSLVAVMHSPDWVAYSTAQDKIYFVNTQTQGL